jgi:hypothetical protein
MQEQTEAAGAPAAAAAPAGPATASVRLLFLLDITGSMSEEIEACKGAMQGLVSMCTSQLQDLAGQISFAVITFTEDDRAGCFTSLFESTSAEEAQAYVNRIELAVPPEAPQYSAFIYGCDGPENHKVSSCQRPYLNVGTTLWPRRSTECSCMNQHAVTACLIQQGLIQMPSARGSNPACSSNRCHA